MPQPRTLICIRRRCRNSSHRRLPGRGIGSRYNPQTPYTWTFAKTPLFFPVHAPDINNILTAILPLSLSRICLQRCTSFWHSLPSCLLLWRRVDGVTTRMPQSVIWLNDFFSLKRYPDHSGKNNSRKFSSRIRLRRNLIIMAVLEVPRIGPIKWNSNTPGQDHGISSMRTTGSSPFPSHFPPSYRPLAILPFALSPDLL